ncbi:hypothetical protein ACFVUH_16635 [Kitasatospora sp. NPDC058032]
MAGRTDRRLTQRTDKRAMASLAAPNGGQQWTTATEAFARLRVTGGNW